ncbi:hypothetical protein U7230_08850 [Carboxydochorda subterranea]|uniref:Uncharacterized protein n=1 Tax=Carboxydichorda subterranea TaxID=3109565 RepID=A0ABZ1BTR8_9FIRM|nr:hypothetical protein [Limnochorda sp. L945t]WRP16210.1 hypothetical protein U7230_08850 [Limnochorda sp. L945t]
MAIDTAAREASLRAWLEEVLQTEELADGVFPVHVTMTGELPQPSRVENAPESRRREYAVVAA